VEMSLIVIYFWRGRLAAAVCLYCVTLQEQRERGIPVFDLDSFMSRRLANVNETTLVSG